MAKYVKKYFLHIYILLQGLFIAIFWLFQVDGQFCFCDKNDCNIETCDPVNCDCVYADPDSCINQASSTTKATTKTTIKSTTPIQSTTTSSSVSRLKSWTFWSISVLIVTFKIRF